jgi:hypothetical protein
MVAGPGERVSRGCLSSGDGERLYSAKVARIARGTLTSAETRGINEQAARLDPQWRGGPFNGLDTFHFRFPEQGATMAAFLLRERLHRLVPGSPRAPTPEDVETEWRRRAQERDAILAWARSTKLLMEIVQAYRFERRQGARTSLDAGAGVTLAVRRPDARLSPPRGTRLVGA